METDKLLANTRVVRPEQPSTDSLVRMPGLQKRRGGRPRKGERKVTSVLVPIDVRAAIERAAEEEGWASLSDYLNALIARGVGMPERAPEPKYPAKTHGEELPLTG